MIGLDREDACGSGQVSLAGDQRGSPVVSRDADVLEDIGGKQEAVVVRIGIEGLVRAN